MDQEKETKRQAERCRALAQRIVRELTPASIQVLGGSGALAEALEKAGAQLLPENAEPVSYTHLHKDLGGFVQYNTFVSNGRSYRYIGQFVSSRYCFDFSTDATGVPLSLIHISSPRSSCFWTSTPPLSTLPPPKRCWTSPRASWPKRRSPA